MTHFLEFFSYTFIQRALIAGFLLSLCASLLGTGLVLKQFSMLGDGLSHVSFGSIAVSVALGVSPYYVSIPAAIAVSVFILRVHKNGSLSGDSLTAVISGVSLALGVLVLSGVGANVDVNSFMFGSVISLSQGDTAVSMVLCLIVTAAFLFLYHKTFAITFDETFSKATGVRTELLGGITAALTAVTVVVCMKIMGVLLISSLLIFPTLSAARVCKSYTSVTVAGAVISLLCFAAGFFISVSFNRPMGACVVISHAIVFFTVSIFAELRG